MDGNELLATLVLRQEEKFNSLMQTKEERAKRDGFEAVFTELKQEFIILTTLYYAIEGNEDAFRARLKEIDSL